MYRLWLLEVFALWYVIKVNSQCNQLPLTPLFTPAPCYLPPSVPLTPIPQPSQPCRGCPNNWFLPEMMRLPNVFPDQSGEYSNKLPATSDRFTLRETKITRIPSPFDEPENVTTRQNVSQYASPIVPQIPSYYRPYQERQTFYPNNIGCGIWTQPAPQPFPTPAPLPPPIVPLPQPILPPQPLLPPQPILPPPINACCQPCSQCPQSQNPHWFYNRLSSNPKAHATKFLQLKPAKCTNQKLRDIMEKHKSLSIVDARSEVQREAELLLETEYYHVICSNSNLEYTTRTESFCTLDFADGICYAFGTQRFA